MSIIYYNILQDYIHTLSRTADGADIIREKEYQQKKSPDLPDRNSRYLDGQLGPSVARSRGQWSSVASG